MKIFILALIGLLLNVARIQAANELTIKASINGESVSQVYSKEKVTFRADGPNADRIQNWSWQFQDGTPATSSEEEPESEFNPAFDPANPNTPVSVEITVSGTDLRGNKYSGSLTLTIKPCVPDWEDDWRCEEAPSIDVSIQANKVVWFSGSFVATISPTVSAGTKEKRDRKSCKPPKSEPVSGSITGSTWTVENATISYQNAYSAVIEPNGVGPIRITVVVRGTSEICDEFSTTASTMVNAIRAKILLVSFTDNIELTKDNYSGSYGVPHWQDGVATLKPVAYARDTKPTIRAKLEVEGSPGGISATIKASGTDTVTFPETECDASFATEPTPAEGKWQNRVLMFGEENPYSFNWQVKFAYDEGLGTQELAYKPVGASNHVVYVTLGSPVTYDRQESLFLISCRSALALASEATVATAVWDDFTDCQVKRKDGVVFHYWKAIPTTHSSTAMLADNQGNGSCLAFAQLFQRLLQIQGIGGANVVEVLSSYVNENAQGGPSGLLVRNREFTGAGTTGEKKFPYYFPAEVPDISGVPAQGVGNSDPVLKTFGNHYLVSYNHKLYDPSYGSAPSASREAWEIGALAGFDRYNASNQHVARKKTGGVECTYPGLALGDVP